MTGLTSHLTDMWGHRRVWYWTTLQSVCGTITLYQYNGKI